MKSFSLDIEQSEVFVDRIVGSHGSIIANKKPLFEGLFRNILA
jgi:hypothetical protein